MEPNPLQLRVTRLLKGTATFEDRFVPDHAELASLLAQLREMGCAVVFTMGVWDLFHIGHAEYIQRGNAEHIIMVVGVDTDALTRQRKGPKRPIVPEGERQRVLSHLRSVDIITPQYEFNQLYQIVRPDVQIISTSTKDLPANIDHITQYCVHLVNLEPQAETSTTARVRGLALDGSLTAIEQVSNKLLRALEEARNELSS
jgi:cytidyltransferase-like protein